MSDPAARALEAYIGAAVAHILSGGPERTRQNGLLFLSSWQEAMPALVHLDPVLEPVDSRVFAVLWLWAKQEGKGATAFPSYPILLSRCNVQSRATIARSLAILRITRWVTLCRRVRDASGRHRGNIYALHEEPLALASTVYLDPSYMAFLQSAKGHRHERVAAVAQAMIESLQTSIAAGEDVLGTSPLSAGRSALGGDSGRLRPGRGKLLRTAPGCLAGPELEEKPSAETSPGSKRRSLPKNELSPSSKSEPRLVSGEIANTMWPNTSKRQNAA